MSYIPDLNYYTIVAPHKEPIPRLVAVGWLEPEYEYTKGTIEPSVEKRVNQLLATVPKWVGQSLGIYECRFSHPSDFDIQKTMCSKVCTAPGKDCIYVFPSLILHYIMDHGYAPPEEFCQAILEAPQPCSLEYYARLQELIDTTRADPVVFEQHRALRYHQNAGQ